MLKYGLLGGENTVSIYVSTAQGGSTYANDVMVYVCCDAGSIKAKQSGCGKEGVKQRGLVV